MHLTSWASDFVHIRGSQQIFKLKMRESYRQWVGEHAATHWLEQTAFPRHLAISLNVLHSVVFAALAGHLDEI
jgi:hypothetical protein